MLRRGNTAHKASQTIHEYSLYLLEIKPYMEHGTQECIERIASNIFSQKYSLYDINCLFGSDIFMNSIKAEYHICRDLLNNFENKGSQRFKAISLNIIKVIIILLEKLSKIICYFKKISGVQNLSPPSQLKFQLIQKQLINTYLSPLYKYSLFSTANSRNIILLSLSRFIHNPNFLKMEINSNTDSSIDSMPPMIVCRICEKKVLLSNISQHSALCKQFCQNKQTLNKIDKDLLNSISSLQDVYINSTSTSNDSNAEIPLIKSASQSNNKSAKLNHNVSALQCASAFGPKKMIDTKIIDNYRDSIINKSPALFLNRRCTQPTPKFEVPHKRNVKLTNLQCSTPPTKANGKFNKMSSYITTSSSQADEVRDPLKEHLYEGDFFKASSKCCIPKNTKLLYKNNTVIISNQKQFKRSETMQQKVVQGKEHDYTILNRLRELTLDAYRIKFQSANSTDAFKSIISQIQNLKDQRQNCINFVHYIFDKLQQKLKILQNLENLLQSIKSLELFPDENINTIKQNTGEIKPICAKKLDNYKFKSQSTKITIQEAANTDHVVINGEYIEDNSEKIKKLISHSTVYHEITIPNSLLRANSNITDYALHSVKYSSIASFKKALSFSLESSKSTSHNATPNFDVQLHISIKDFKIIKPLSKGSYGCVCLAQKIGSGDYFALKILDRKKVIEKNQIEFVNNEQNILKMVGNEHVIKCFYMFQSERFLFFVLEYMVGGDLGSLLKWAGAFFEEDAKFYLSQIVAALEYLHNSKIVHKDLKPDNLLIGADGNIKLSDFGLSEAGLIKKYNSPNIRRKTHTNLSSPEGKSKLYNTSMTTISDEKINYDPQMNEQGGSHYFKRILTLPPKQIIGTPNYLAPEVIDGKEISFAIDWWSLGIIAFQMLTGYLPFQGATVNEIFANIVNRAICLPRIGTKENNISVEAYDLINRLLDGNPVTRLGAAGPLEVKNHPFFKGVNWKNIKNGKPPQVPDILEESDTKFFDQSRASFSIEEFVRENYDDEQNDWKIKAGEAFGDFNSTMFDSVADLNIQCAKKMIQKREANSK